jgi:superfamily I DNA and/or RNA helicase
LNRAWFDIVIIDEASQVSIAQAFPAFVRAKQLVVLGDRRQFSNVKTTNASPDIPRVDAGCRHAQPTQNV